MLTALFQALLTFLLFRSVVGRWFVRPKRFGPGDPVRPGLDRVTFRLAAGSSLLATIVYLLQWEAVQGPVFRIAIATFLFHIAAANWQASEAERV